MIASDVQISQPSLVWKQNSSHLHSLCVGILFNCTALGIHLCKTSQLYVLKTRLGGEIYSSDVNMHKGYLITFFMCGIPCCSFCLLDCSLYGLCHVICHLFQNAKTFFAPTEFQKNGPVLSFNTSFRQWNCFPSSVAKDGKDGHRLNLEKNWLQLVLNFNAMLQKSPKKILWLHELFPDEKGERPLVMFLAQNWPKTAVSLSHRPFKS